MLIINRVHNLEILVIFTLWRIIERALAYAKDFKLGVETQFAVWGY